QPVVGHDEAVSLGYVEPLDDAAELDNARNFITDIADRCAISADTNSWPLGSNAIRRSHDPARRSPPAPSAKWRPPNPSDKLRISLGSAVQSDKCSLCNTRLLPVNIFLCDGSWYSAQCAINGDRTVPISSCTTRSAMSSNSVASRLRMTRRAPLRLAIRGNPAAGHTTSEEPIARKRSQDLVIFSARCIAASGIACPNETVADLMCPSQSGQSGACPDALNRSLTHDNS